MDRGAWQSTAHRVAKSGTRLSVRAWLCQETWVRALDQEDRLEEEMATHSNILAWRIP